MSVLETRAFGYVRAYLDRSGMAGMADFVERFSRGYDREDRCLLDLRFVLFAAAARSGRALNDLKGVLDFAISTLPLPYGLDEFIADEEDLDELAEDLALMGNHRIRADINADLAGAPSRVWVHAYVARASDPNAVQDAIRHRQSMRDIRGDSMLTRLATFVMDEEERLDRDAEMAMSF